MQSDVTLTDKYGLMAALTYSDETVRKQYERMYGKKVTEPPPGLIMRKATAQDYEAVLQLSDGTEPYFALDHMSALYHEFLQDPSRHMYVAELQGEVVRWRRKLVELHWSLDMRLLFIS